MKIDLKKSFLFSKLCFLFLLLIFLNNCSTKTSATIINDLSYENIEIDKTYNLSLIRFDKDEISLFKNKFTNKKNIKNFKTISSNMSSKNFAFESGIGLSNIEEYIIEIFQSIKNVNIDNLRIDMHSTTIVVERLV